MLAAQPQNSQEVLLWFEQLVVCQCVSAVLAPPVTCAETCVPTVNTHTQRYRWKTMHHCTSLPLSCHTCAHIFLFPQEPDAAETPTYPYPSSAPPAAAGKHPPSCSSYCVRGEPLECLRPGNGPNTHTAHTHYTCSGDNDFALFYYKSDPCENML